MQLQDFDPAKSWFRPNKDNTNIWYIGTQNSIRKGLDALFDNLNKNKYILIGDMVLFDYMSESDELVYVILYKALLNLEYLEYKLKEKGDKNVS